MDEELDIFVDTLGANEFFDSTVSDSAMAAEGQETKTYWVITSNAKGGDASPFTGDTARLVQMTEQELRQVYKDSGQIQDHFGTFENYMTYIGESQDWIESADWMNATMEYDPSDRKWLHQMNEDVMWKPGEREELERQISNDQANAKQSAYIGWLNAGSELLEKWGLNDKRVIYNSDGDQFKWTGSGYQKTIKVDDHASFADYASAVLKSVVVSMVTGAVTQGLLGAFNVTGSDLLAKLPAGVKDFIRGNEVLSGALKVVADQLPGLIAGGATGGGSLNNQIDGMFDSTWNNVIVNLAGSDLGDQDGDTKDPVGIDNGDGTSTYDYERLPSLYELIVDEKGYPTGVRNTETGEEYGIEWSPYGGRVILPNLIDDSKGGGGGAAEDPSADADNDGVPASQDPDDNNPDVPVQGGDKDATTDGEKVDENGTPVGLEYRWKYIGEGCFVQIDENGQELPETKVCDPNYTEEDYEFYEVGGIFSRGTDAPFGTPDGNEETDTTPVDAPPAAGTQTEDCLPNGDKIIYTADGEGNWEENVIAGGCLDKEEDAGVITLGESPVWDGGADAGDSEAVGDADSGDADTDADGDGTKGTGDEGAGDDGAGEDGTGEGDGGDGTGEGDGGDGEVSLGGGMMGKPASFQGMMAGLSYEPQPIPGIKPTPQIDYATDLEELIARQLKNRGMFT